MKKVFLLAVSLTITIMANAQASVQVGFMLNTLKTEVKSEQASYLSGKYTGAYKGFMALVDYNLHLTDYLGVAPGLGIDYSFNKMEGSKYKELGLFAPIDINYCLPISDDLSLSLFVGPTFYYGLFSRETAVNPPYDYYANDSKRFDLSLGGGFWLDIIEDIRFKVSYKFGLTNNSKIASVIERNNCLSISVGYVF